MKYVKFEEISATHILETAEATAWHMSDCHASPMIARGLSSSKIMDLQIGLQDMGYGANYFPDVEEHHYPAHKICTELHRDLQVAKRPGRNVFSIALKGSSIFLVCNNQSLGDDLRGPSIDQSVAAICGDDNLLELDTYRDVQRPLDVVIFDTSAWHAVMNLGPNRHGGHSRVSYAYSKRQQETWSAIFR